MAIFLALAFLALIVGLWAFVVLRFQLRWWTVILTVLLLAALFVLFFQAEDEETDGETPQSQSRDDPPLTTP
jgi:membrane protein implicated in regulation of membrane protease activity